MHFSHYIAFVIEVACGFIAKISGDALVIFLPDCLKIPAIQTAREKMKTQKQHIFSILAILTMAVILTCIFAACDKVEPDKTGTDIVSEYKVTIHPNNGQGDIVWDITKAIPTIRKDGFHIAGYYLDAQLTISTTLESLKATGITKNIDVYVKWAKDVCEHTGGTATCTEQAVCEKCNAKYGELAKHNYKDGVCIVCGIRHLSEGLEYSLNSYGNGYTVMGIGTCADKELIIPSDYNAKPVTSIGDYAFSDCTGLTSVTIGGSVTNIGDYAFSDCTRLTSVTIPDSVTSIGERAFYYCKGLTSVTIGKGVTHIGSSAFMYCTGLTSVTIPDSVTSIGECVFRDCTGLMSIKFNGTIEQWNAISKGYYWKDGVPATQVVCTDGTISI